MQFSIEVKQPEWQPVINIPQGTELMKGRHDELYRSIMGAAIQVKARYGCYCWRSEEEVFYVGSFRTYARKGYKSSLHGRVHNYLHNHRIGKNGRINTNLMVFNRLNSALLDLNVSLALFRFENLRVGKRDIKFTAFSSASTFIHVVEELLICSYRQVGQCTWNRT